MINVASVPSGKSKTENYREIYNQLAELVKGESDFLANAANTAALLNQVLPDINWVGFYFVQERELVLGPFQGKPACTRIKFNEGVCGTAAAKSETIIVPDVNQFAGHIACDAASRSEIVVPLLNWGKLLGVLDIDSPVVGRFDEDDKEGLESLTALLVASHASSDLPDFESLADDPSL
jgi:L-methionine (R)-S-oxide reductase